MIKEIIDKHANPSANLKDLRTASICSLGFAGFLRYDELSKILVSHFRVFSTLYLQGRQLRIYQEVK